jgi:hypothetical protein
MTVVSGKIQVVAQALAQVVAMEAARLAAALEQLALQFDGNGGLAGRGKSRKPDDAAAMPVKALAFLQGDFACVRMKVCGFGPQIFRHAA